MKAFQIYAKPDNRHLDEMFCNTFYDGAYAKSFKSTVLWKQEPTEEEIIEHLKILRPLRKYYLGSVRIKFLGDWVNGKLINEST